MKIIDVSHQIIPTNKNWRRKKKGLPVGIEPEKRSVKTSPASPHRDIPIQASILGHMAPSSNGVGDKCLTLLL